MRQEIEKSADPEGSWLLPMEGEKLLFRRQRSQTLHAAASFSTRAGDPLREPVPDNTGQPRRTAHTDSANSTSNTTAEILAATRNPRGTAGTKSSAANPAMVTISPLSIKRPRSSATDETTSEAGRSDVSSDPLVASPTICPTKPNCPIASDTSRSPSVREKETFLRSAGNVSRQAQVFTICPTPAKPEHQENAPAYRPGIF